MPKKYKVQLTEKEEQELTEITSKGSIKVRVYKRVQILLLANEKRKGGAKSDEQIAEIVLLSTPTVQRIRQRFVEGGLANSLYDKARSGAPKKFTGQEKAQITALACSTAPEGRNRWTLRLLAEKMVELKYVDSLSYDTVQQVLKKTNLSLISNDSGVSES